MSAVRTYENSERPDGWRLVRLGELVGMNQGGTPRKEDPEYWDGSIPFLTGADLTDFRVGRQHARSFLTDAGLVSGHTTVCEAGTLLLATRTRVGLAGIATELMGASQDITCLYPNEQIDSEFLCRTLLRLAPELQRLSRGTTIQGITREDVCSVPVLIPPLSEQRAIADVLDSIDETIDRTEAVIAATETLRDALLHELLTRGVPRLAYRVQGCARHRHHPRRLEGRAVGGGDRIQHLRDKRTAWGQRQHHCSEDEQYPTGRDPLVGSETGGTFRKGTQ